MSYVGLDSTDLQSQYLVDQALVTFAVLDVLI